MSIAEKCIPIFTANSDKDLTLIHQNLEDFRKSVVSTMHKNLSGVTFPLLSSLTVGGILIFNVNQVLAQVTPDSTLGDESSVVNTRDATSDKIDGGAIRGQNLFHSFQEFNVDAGRGVYFANPEAVTNIFSRVTGNNASNILGTLGVDGAANLFLINPNGIIFGEDASLDVNGSFAATTADGIEFGDRGFFSASNPESPPLLTINPSAYLFNQVAPGVIANNSRANNNIGLQVQPGKNISLIGGDMSLDGGGMYAPGGRVELGGLNAAGTIGISNDGSLSFPENIARSDVFLSNGGAISVISEQGGSIAVNAKKIEISGKSLLLGGVFKQTNLPDNKSGDIVLNAIEAIDIDSSRISNTVVKLGAFGIGNAGNININTGSLSLTNGAVIDNITQGIGNAGNIKIVATDTIFADGGAIGSTVQEDAEGDAGEVDISTGKLALTNVSQINNGVFGKGNGGNIKVTAADSIFVDNNSFITSEIFEGAEGNAGNIDIDANHLTLTNEGEIVASTSGRGNGGSIKINANNTFSVDSSKILSGVSKTAEGNAGVIEISTNNLTLINGGQVNASTAGKGNGGNVKVNATNSISLDGLLSAIASGVSSSADGKGGEIEITTSNLNLTNESQIVASTNGKGNGGTVKITSDSVSIDNSAINSGAFEAEGNAGNINIGAYNLTLTNEGEIFASTNGKGNGGIVKITSDSVSIDNSAILSSTFGTEGGNGGEIEISTRNLKLINTSAVDTSTYGRGDAGSINITADAGISLNGSGGIGSSAFETAEGNGGKIEIETPNFFLNNGAQLTTQSFGLGNAGNIKVSADSINIDNNSAILASNNPSTDISTTLSGGNIDLEISDNIILRDSNISTQASINANGGNIDITADAIIAFDDSDIFAFAADGQGGNITLDTPAYFAENFTLNSLTRDPDFLDNNSRADLNATGAVSGVVSIPDVSFIQNSLNNLPDNSINTDELVANSCVSPVGKRQEGKFIITGTGGLPDRPGNGLISDFATGEVRNVPSNNSGWHRGEPIVEPQGVYRLTNGKLVMSRECSQPKK
jgi:filamentous hemagglutinin family protein